MEDEAEDEVRSDVEPFPRERSNTWHGGHPVFVDHKQPKFAAISERSSCLSQNEDEDDYIDDSDVLSYDSHLPSSDQATNDESDHLLASNSSAGRRNSVRRNAWGNASYAELITQAIESVPDKRLTLMQIYDWMIQNIPYFRERADGTNSMGWKNSVRHNLSLHDQFSRIQNEGTGKSSWWVVNKSMLKSRLPRTRRATMGDTALLDKKRLKAGKNLKRILGYTSTSMLYNEDKDEDGDENIAIDVTANTGHNSPKTTDGKVKREATLSPSDKNYLQEDKRFGHSLGGVSKKIRTCSVSTENSVLNYEVAAPQESCSQRRSSFTVSSSSNDFEEDTAQKQQSKKAQLINALLNRHRLKNSMIAQQKQQHHHHQLQNQQNLHPITPTSVSYVVCTTMPLSIQPGQLCLAMSSFNNNNNNNIASSLQLQPQALQFQSSHLQLQQPRIQFQSQPLQLQARPVSQILQLQPQHIHIQQQQLQLQSQNLQVQPQHLQFQSHQLLLQPQLHIQPQIQQQATNNIILNVQPSSNQIPPLTIKTSTNDQPFVLYMATSKSSVPVNQSQSNQLLLTGRQSFTTQDIDISQGRLLQQASQSATFDPNRSLLHINKPNTSADSQTINKYINTDLNKQALNMTLTDPMACNKEGCDESDDENLLLQQHLWQQQQQQQRLHKQQQLQHHQQLHEQQYYVKQQIQNIEQNLSEGRSSQQSQILGMSEKRQKMLLNLLHSERFCEIRRNNPEFNKKIVEILERKKKMLQQSALESLSSSNVPAESCSQQQQLVETFSTADRFGECSRSEQQQSQQHCPFPEQPQQSRFGIVNNYISNLSSSDDNSEENVLSDDNDKEQNQAISSSNIVSDGDDGNSPQLDGAVDRMHTEDLETESKMSLNDDEVNNVINDINFEESINELFNVDCLLNCDDDFPHSFPNESL